MQCGQCGESNPENAKFCIGCAAPFSKRCATCGTENPPRAKFCAECAASLSGADTDVKPPPTVSQSPTAERRQLTVMFCDLVGSTVLSTQLDPEELRAVVRGYQETCTTVIERYDGHIAQHLGDGLLIYFGYPTSHEDDAARAVRAGLEIIHALRERSVEAHPSSSSGAAPLQVRVGIHTGLVVIGEIGSSEKREMLALGETPNIAARIQGSASPDEILISAVTSRLVAGLFDTEAHGLTELKGIATPMMLYRVVGESTAQNRFEVAVQTGLTPLVGRMEELALLQRRWEQAKAGEGQMVLLAGEPGIGKSRLVQELKEHVTVDRATRIEFRCSAYHHNSAFYPILTHVQRLLAFVPEDTPQDKLAKLQQQLAQYRFPQSDTCALLAALLSLPQPEGSQPLALSPQKQKQRTQEALVAWIIEEAAKDPIYCVWEDLHWADPSTLEVLTLFLDQVPSARLLATLTYRPEFVPPWKSRSYMSHVTLNRLGRSQTEAIVQQVAGDHPLPTQLIQQIVSKTDGVPLFIEEVTKSVIDSVGALPEAPLRLEIPTTLQDALMARLDRLGPAKEIAQVGAVLGREFSYELLHAVSPGEETAVQQGLGKLVDADLLYQRGVLPHAVYTFKHALIQDTAYQSLLKSTRQQCHQQIAHILEERFVQTKETQPELVAHHYTEANLIAQAIPYWSEAGQKAIDRSAHTEAISHLSKGLELLKTLPKTLELAEREFALQIAFGESLMAVKGYSAPEVGEAYACAREFSRQVGETPQLFLVLGRLGAFYVIRGEVQTARELMEQLLSLAQRLQRQTMLQAAHYGMGEVLLYLGELSESRDHLDQAIALYRPQKHRARALHDPGVACLAVAALTLWSLGYPDQALKRMQESLTLAEELSHPFSLAFALSCSAVFHQLRQEEQAVQERAQALITLSHEHGFALRAATGTVLLGWTLAKHGHLEEGISQMRQGIALCQAAGAELWTPGYLTLLAETCGKAGQAEKGLSLVAEALITVGKKGAQRGYAELYRLKGDLTLQSRVQSRESRVKEAEECFHKAIEIARKQKAKSWELRAATNLARLWRQQGKKAEAHKLLSEIYNWFTEGFDTKDLQDAKALLGELE